MSKVKISPTNIGNRLKMPEAGFKRWREHTFFEGWNKDGTMRTREGWKNTLTDREWTPPEGWNGEPPAGDHGDLACVSHSGDAYREGYERIKWESASQPSES